jgi:hypothetical protein
MFGFGFQGVLHKYFIHIMCGLHTHKGLFVVALMIFNFNYLCQCILTHSFYD